MFDRLKAQRGAWTPTSSTKSFPGVVGLRVDPNTSGIVLKSVFATMEIAGYARITFEIAGSPTLYDVATISSEPQHVAMPSVVNLKADDAHPGNVSITWRRRGAVISERSTPSADVAKTVCADWKADKQVHNAPTDPAFDEAIIHFDDKAKAGDLVPLLEAVAMCRRDRSGTEGPVFVPLFPTY